jgi:ParB/RepB/Spo0J family partition protein
VTQNQLNYILIGNITVGSNIRADFDGLEGLTQSIQEHGVLQPIAVRPLGGRFELISGGRRFEAAKRAGLKEIPAVIRNADEIERLAQQIIENVQREDLTPLDESNALHRYQALTGETPTQIARKLGKSSDYIKKMMLIASSLTRAEKNDLRAMEIQPSRSALLEAVVTDDPALRASVLRGEVYSNEARTIRRREAKRNGKRPNLALRFDLPTATVRIQFKKQRATKTEAIAVLRQAEREVAETSKWSVAAR